MWKWILLYGVAAFRYVSAQWSLFTSNVALSLVLSSGSCSLGALAGGVSIRLGELCADGVLAFRFQWILLTGSRCSGGFAVAFRFVSAQWIPLTWRRGSRVRFCPVESTFMEPLQSGFGFCHSCCWIITRSKFEYCCLHVGFWIFTCSWFKCLVAGYSRAAASSAAGSGLAAKCRWFHALVQAPRWRLGEGNWCHVCCLIVTCIRFECSWFYLGLLTPRWQLAIAITWHALP
jgi:hypothetical protein